MRMRVNVAEISQAAYSCAKGKSSGFEAPFALFCEAKRAQAGRFFVAVLAALFRIGKSRLCRGVGKDALLLFGKLDSTLFLLFHTILHRHTR